MIAKACLIFFIGLVVWAVLSMASNESVLVDECKDKGGTLIRLYVDGVKCVDLNKITLD